MYCNLAYKIGIWSESLKIYYNCNSRLLLNLLPCAGKEKEGKPMANEGEISSQFPRFFRVIVNEILKDGILELPRDFAKEFGKVLLYEYVHLKVPTGAMWEIALKRSRGKAWLDEGWQDVVEDCSIQCGFFLVFEYESESVFNVLIFNLTTSEIEYPKKTKAGKYKVIEIKEEDSEDEDDNQFSDDQVSVGPEESKNPRFIIQMFPSYVSCKGRVHVPSEHSRRYLIGDKHGENVMIIHGSCGKTWNLQYRHLYNAQNRFRKTVISITHGWRKLVSDNNLQLGDKCVFEMIFGKANEYKFTVRRQSM